jgi:putative ABC transport system permease protein
MRALSRDLWQIAFGAVWAHRLRSLLSMLGIAVAVTAVSVLTAMGEGTRRYIVGEFAQFGTNLLSVTPGRVTTGGMPGGIGATMRKLTVADAEAIRRARGVERVVPVEIGQVRVNTQARGRSVFAYGVTADALQVWKLRLASGQFLPAGRNTADAVAVVGSTLQRELFGTRNPLGQTVHVGGRRFVVIGALAPRGQFVGVDLDDAVYLPVASAQDLFGHAGVTHLDVQFASHANPEAVVRSITGILARRHAHEEDFTITTQAEMLDTLDRVLGVVSLAVVGIAAIALVVGSMGILTIMWITVGERTAEVGLLKAVGARDGQVTALFLMEAATLSGLGGVLGLIAAGVLLALVSVLWPALPIAVLPRIPVLAVAVSVATGLLAGVLPARRAARLDPVDALRAE